METLNTISKETITKALQDLTDGFDAWDSVYSLDPSTCVLNEHIELESGDHTLRLTADFFFNHENSHNWEIESIREVELYVDEEQVFDFDERHLKELLSA